MFPGGRASTRAVALAALLCVTSLAAGCDGGGSDDGDATNARDAPARDAPNVVLVLTDDQERDSVRVMPRLRREVAAQGVTYTDAYATTPECCPSRASFFTGQYAHNHGVLSNGPPDGGVNAFDDSNALPVWLNDAGYRTGYVGKYLNGYGFEALGNDATEIPNGWADWIALTKHTEYRMYGYTLNENGELVDYGDSPADYQTDVLARKGAELIDRYAGKRPFFITVAPLAPHDEGVLEGTDAPRDPRPAPRDDGRFEDAPLRRSPAFNEPDVADKPPYVRRDPQLGAAERDELERLERSRLESLVAVDRLVARLVRALRERRELDDTLFVYTSDNGFMLGEHRQVGKEKVYEESVGVPLIVRGPGFAARTRSETPVANIDLAPTILDLAGIEPRLEVDGAPLTAGRPPRDGLLLETLAENSFVAVRSERYLFAEVPKGDTELYDLARDPHQLENLAGDPRHAQAEAHLAALLDRLRDCAGASCRYGP